MPDAHATPEPIRAADFAKALAACGIGVDVGALAVAVSGGADSMALCLLAANWGREHGVKVSALTVDHGLRPEAAEEARTVAGWLRSHEISHHILRWNEGSKPSSAIQARAREARYGLMGAWCAEHDVRHLLVAHHREDQAETVLMRLKKGSGLLGLAAMASTRETAGVTVVRPLLDMPKSRLRATLQACGQDWVEDPSNRNPAFERVRVRQNMTRLQLEGVSTARLAGVARACGRLRDVLKSAADGVFRDAKETDKGLELALSVFNDHPRLVRDVALAQVLARIGGGAYPAQEAKRARILDWLEGAGRWGGGARTLGGCELRLISRDTGPCLRIAREKPRKNNKNAEKPRIISRGPLAPGG